MRSSAASLAAAALFTSAALIAGTVLVAGPPMVETKVVDLFRQQQTLLAEQGSRRIEEALAGVEARLTSPLEREASEIESARTPEELRIALARLGRPSDARFGITLFVHDDGGHVIAVSPRADHEHIDEFLAHDHQPQPVGAGRSFGACQKCVEKAAQLSVTTRLADDRRLAANIDLERLAGEVFEQITRGRNARAALVDGDGEEQYVVKTAEVGGQTEWISGDAAIPDSDWKIRVDAPRGSISADIDRTTRQLFSASGGVLGLVLLGLSLLGTVVYREHQARLMRARALAHQDKLATLGTLAAAVCHEINNAIMIATLNLDEVAQTAADTLNPEQGEMLEHASGALEGLAELSGELNQFARQERSAEDFDVSEAVESALRIVRPKLETRARIGLQIDVRPIVHGSRTALSQVLINLILNAFEAADATAAPEDGAQIEIRVGQDGPLAIIAVTDNGPGVPTALRERVFEPFFSSKDGEDQHGGTGIGLWMCARIVEDHDGSIHVEDADDGGACFVVELPAVLA